MKRQIIQVRRWFKKDLFNKGIRVTIDDRTEKTGFKIREAQLDKIAYMVIVGEKEEHNNTISVRSRDEGELGELNLDQFIKTLIEKIENREDIVSK